MKGDAYAALRAGFRWNIPARCNLAEEVCDRWADGSRRLAMMQVLADGVTELIGYDDLRHRSCKLANLFLAMGIGRGDRIGVLLPQCQETLLTHLAAWRIGAISVPLFTLFGEEALAYRLRDCAAVALVTDGVGAGKLRFIRDHLPALRHVLDIDGGADLHKLIEPASDRHDCVATGPDDPALIIYTSGTTGSPKGALHGHRVLRGHLPGVEMPHEFFPQPEDTFWTPADWAWIGGLLDVLLPSLYHGVTVVAHRMAKFDPDYALRLMAHYRVRNAFLPPTALRMLRQVPNPASFGLDLRSVGSGGESLGAEMLDWGRAAFGLTINEFYGQTECNLTISSCAGLFPVKPGAIGKPVPGHEVAILGPDGAVLPRGAEGTIAIRAPDPVMFLGYWNRPEATAAKFHGDWLLTGDQAVMDEEDYVTFVGRDDDVITSAGYRIGPGEIEDFLQSHPAIAAVAVIGLPDALRTERVCAVVVPKPGIVADQALVSDIQRSVATRLAGHLYPRQVEFVDALPQTTTGKIMRGELRRRFATKD
ncbi:acyl-CoA synthetase [Falsiroseomonas stagni]|uniref:Acetyl-CoA synthetase n=1 Tax=Falsiroseomonas stagni DSM 19981 TaxID=1123062 RepID=A0A1I4ED05_9PROT|nr:acyl-CoA synthetase [Falsiroseomonas stagni]SFL03674.1 acetyl-CoA synthetase [Falsiroseomonas stagni DSM 19981]